MGKRFLIIRGEKGIEVDSADTLEEAKKLVEDYDLELTPLDWDNIENHWIPDTETGEEIY